MSANGLVRKAARNALQEVNGGAERSMRTPEQQLADIARMHKIVNIAMTVFLIAAVILFAINIWGR